MIKIQRPLRQLFTAMFVTCAFGVTDVLAYKISYKGLSPFVSDFPAAHENNTSEAWRHFCSAHPNLSPLREAPMSGLLTRDYSDCADLLFSPSTDDFVNNLQVAPLAGILLGSRYPDLRELTGLDANKQNAVIVNYRDQVEFDVYRIAPISHGQLSQFHNVFGGDQVLGLQKFREYIRSTLFEAWALLLSRSEQTSNENWFVASSHVWNHDLEQNHSGLWHNVPWTHVLTGAAFHAIEDSYSHDPLIIMDPDTNRAVRGSLFYGRFTDANGQVVGVKDMYSSIHPDISGTMEAFSHVPPIPFRAQGAELNIAEIPQTTIYNGQNIPLYFASNGKRYATGYTVGALSVAAVSEYLSTLYFMLHNSHDAAAIELVVEQYLDKYFSWDLHTVSNFTPHITYPYAHDQNQRAALPWSNFELVDLWQQSGIDDNVAYGKKALILPWTDRSSMGDLLQDEAIEERIVIANGEQESFDPTTGIFTAAPKTLYIFHSWNDLNGDNITRVGLDDKLFYVEAPDGLEVQEVEFNIDGGYRGLDSVKAFAWVPAGYRLCLHYPHNGSGATYGPRLAIYDTYHERYRCYYGGDAGRLVHNNFHLSASMRLSVLPIDSDGDGVPFLRGINDVTYSDSCPMDPNISDDPSACPNDDLDPPGGQVRFIVSNFFGGTGGGEFNDANLLDVDWKLHRIVIRTGDRLDAITSEYTNGIVLKHGGNGGSEDSLILQDGEFIQRVEISIGSNFWGSRRVHSIRIETNTGRVLSGGRVRSERYEFVAAENQQIVGFIGRSGAEVDALGVVHRETY